MKFEDIFSRPLLSLPYKRQNPHQVIDYNGRKIVYDYNNYGYRTHIIPDREDQPHWVIVGCSHTEGTGIEADKTYASLLEKELGVKVYNLGQAGTNHTTNELNIIKWIENIGRPEQIIAQWPSAYRRLLWDDNCKWPEFANNATLQAKHPLMELTVKCSTRNFLFDQIKSIIIANIFCKTHGIKILNIMIDKQEPVESWLEQNHVILYSNNISQNWAGDGRAADCLHHSEFCHNQWKHRILELVHANDVS